MQLEDRVKQLEGRIDSLLKVGKSGRIDLTKCELNLEIEKIESKNIGINSEHSALLEGIAVNNILLNRLELSRQLLDEQSLLIIESMFMALDSKNDVITQLKQFRRDIQSEANLANKAVEGIKDILSVSEMKNLERFVSLVKELNDVNPSVLIDRLFTTGDK